MGLQSVMMTFLSPNSNAFCNERSTRNAHRMAQHYQKLLVVIGTGVLMTILSLVRLTRSPLAATSSAWGRDGGGGHDVAGRMDLPPSSECEARLDALDRVWDERRSVRSQLVQDARNAGKSNVYDHLWKIPVTDDQSKEREANNLRIQTFDLWEPEAVCLPEERFGGPNGIRYHAFGDGPKFLCGVDYIREHYRTKRMDPPSSLSPQQQESQPCLVYSVGSNNDIKFEMSVKEHMGCEIHTFDPTLTREFVGSEYATFHPWGLGLDGGRVTVDWSSKKITFDTYSLEHVIELLGHTNRKIDILKIDCEGCEYASLPSVFDAVANGRLEIDQILIELHRVPHDRLTVFFEEVDRAGYRITHKERNGWGCQGNGCVEYALVRESFLRRATASVIC